MLVLPQYGQTVGGRPNFTKRTNPAKILRAIEGSFLWHMPVGCHQHLAGFLVHETNKTLYLSPELLMLTEPLVVTSYQASRVQDINTGLR